MKSGAVNGLSIAFEVTQAIFDGEVRHLVKLRMREVSRVIFPMNEPAHSGGDQGQHLNAITGTGDPRLAPSQTRLNHPTREMFT
jgi:phage head maturation protease